MSEKKDSISIKLPLQAEYVGIARLAVSGISSRMGFDIDAIEDIKVAVSEVCSKMIEKALNSGGTYTVECIIGGKSLTIKFTSDMVETDLFDTYSGELAQEIMCALMDTVSFSDKGCFVSMTKNLERENGDE